MEASGGYQGVSVTDLATRPGADEAPSDDETIELAVGGDVAEPTYAWAPTEPAAKNRRLGLWIGIPLGVAAVGLAAASLVLIAPGTSIAGVPVGGLTAGAAADAVSERFASTTIVLTGDGDGASLTAADLGATIDAKALADAAYAEHPAWNVGAWNAEPAEAVVTIDADAATAALRAAAPDLYTDPVDATLAYDEATKAFVATDAITGTGVDVEAVRAALQDAFAQGTASLELAPPAAPVEAHVPTFAAAGAADTANGIISTAGFYVGHERVVPVDRATAASWLTVTQNDRGAFDISADAAAIQKVVDTLKAKVDRAPVTASVITDSDGTVLREITKGVKGRTLATTTGIAAAYAAQIAAGDGSFALDVTEQPFTTVAKARLLEVDLSRQRLYLKENGKVVDSWAISSGKAVTPTYPGRYKINSHIPMQTMRSTHPTDPKWNYVQPDVKWVMYFNGNQGFHGVYWHSNWGTRMSHGCVGMPEWRAKQIYDWAPYGVDVYIHN
jgi:lipoprotein-anchoring transpeptidase ErfK/SrfK